MSLDSQFSTIVAEVDILTQMGSRVASVTVVTGSLNLGEGRREDSDMRLEGQIFWFPGGLLVRVLKDGVPVAAPQVVAGDFSQREKFSISVKNVYVIGHS